MTDRELMQQALEALNRSDYLGWQLNIPIIKALRERLAQPEQEPVAWMCPDDPDRATAFAWNYGYCIDCGKPRIPVYTAPTRETK